MRGGPPTAQDLVEIARFRYFLRVVGSQAPRPAAEREAWIPPATMRPLQRLWVERYARGKLCRGGLRP